MTRRPLFALLFAALALALPALPAAAVQPTFNPSTGSIWLAAPVGAYKDSLFVLAANDTVQWSWGFEANRVAFWCYSKPTWVRLVGKSTLTAAATRQKVPLGYAKNHPIFDSVEWFMPANTSDGGDFYFVRGIKLRSTVAADTFYVRAWKVP